MKNIECETKFHGCVYFTLSKLFRIANKFSEDAFSNLGICSTHGYLLILLEDSKEGLSVNEISEELTIAPSTVTRFVDKLTELGYVERIKIGKQSIAKITKNGLTFMPKVYEAWNNMGYNFSSLIEDKEYLKKVAVEMMKFVETLEEGLAKQELKSVDQE